MLTDDDVNEFIKFYREEFGEILPFADAKQRAEEVMMLLEMLFIDSETPEEDPFIGDLR